MKLMLVGFLVMLVGCSGPSAREDYYAAVAMASAAQAQEAQAKYVALTAMATTSRTAGDDSASVAAVMAIALSQYTPIQPRYIEDQALKWAGILVGPITTLGALSIQSSLSRDLSDNNRDLGIARIDADAETDRALYGALTQQSYSEVPVAPQIPSGLTGDDLNMVLQGFEAISLAGFSEIGTTGRTGIETINVNSQAAYSTIETVALEGLDKLHWAQEAGYQTIENVVSTEHMTLEKAIDHISEGGCCYTCGGPCEPVDPPVVITTVICDGFSPVHPDCPQ
jgi:hypothetical protein